MLVAVNLTPLDGACTVPFWTPLFCCFMVTLQTQNGGTVRVQCLLLHRSAIIFGVLLYKVSKTKQSKTREQKKKHASSRSHTFEPSTPRVPRRRFYLFHTIVPGTTVQLKIKQQQKTMTVRHNHERGWKPNASGEKPVHSNMMPPV